MNDFVASLEDKDAFIVKLPHKFKEYLADQETFTLAKRDLIIGKIIPSRKAAVVNPEGRPSIEELLAPEPNDDKTECIMHLELPRSVTVEPEQSPRKSKNFEPEPKRQKIVIDDVFFDLKFPTAKEIAANRAAAGSLFTLEMQQESESKVTGQLKHRVVGEVVINPKDLRSWDLADIKGLSEEEIALRLKTDDKLKMRDIARVEDIQTFIEPPGNIYLASDSEEADRRVAMSEEQLKRQIIHLF